jgi:hypothetical protein
MQLVLLHVTLLLGCASCTAPKSAMIPDRGMMAPERGTPPAVSDGASQHWVKVSSRPPTFYPRGVAADYPTDFRSGEWVYTGDAQGTRFFIPLRGIVGIPRKTLIDEALSARSEEKKRQIAADKVRFHVMQVLFSPVLIFVPSLGD